MVQFRPFLLNYGTVQTRITVQFSDLRYTSEQPKVHFPAAFFPPESRPTAYPQVIHTPAYGHRRGTPQW